MFAKINKNFFLAWVEENKDCLKFKCIETSPNNPVKNDIAKEIWNILQEK